jgi:hypothetical protein
MSSIELFLSAVSGEFRSYRDELRRSLTTRNARVHVQEDFVATGTETLDMLDRYISRCSAVVHLVGDMTGSAAKSPSLDVIKGRYPDFTDRLPSLKPFLQSETPAISYTQWEAYLAVYHRKPLFVAVPTPDAKRDQYCEDVRQKEAQQAHLHRLREFERHQVSFLRSDHLAIELFRAFFDKLVEGHERDSHSLDALQINRMLILLDREAVVGDIVSGGCFHVLYGPEDCRSDDLFQRLRDVELPWLARGEIGNRLRVVIYLRIRARRRLLGWFAKPSIIEVLAGDLAAGSTPLGAVQRDQLVEWASLMEQVANMPANMVMEQVDEVYGLRGRLDGRVGAKEPLRALPMEALHEQLKARVAHWPSRITRSVPKAARA